MGQTASTDKGQAAPFERLVAVDLEHADVKATLSKFGVVMDKLEEGQSFNGLVQALQKGNEELTTSELERMRMEEVHDMVYTTEEASLDESLTISEKELVESERESEDEFDCAEVDPESFSDTDEEEEEDEDEDNGDEGRVLREGELPSSPLTPLRGSPGDDQEDVKLTRRSPAQGAPKASDTTPRNPDFLAPRDDRDAQPVVYGPMNRDFAALVQGFEDDKPRDSLGLKRTWRSRMSSLRRSFRRRESQSSMDPAVLAFLQAGDDMTSVSTESADKTSDRPSVGSEPAGRKTSSSLSQSFTKQTSTFTKQTSTFTRRLSNFSLRRTSHAGFDQAGAQAKQQAQHTTSTVHKSTSLPAVEVELPPRNSEYMYTNKLAAAEKMEDRATPARAQTLRKGLSTRASMRTLFRRETAR